MFVVWRPTSQDVEEFRRELLEAQVPQLLEIEPLALTVSVADLDGGSKALPRHDGAAVGALVSTLLEDPQDAFPCARVLDPTEAWVAGYVVEEATPLPCAPRRCAEGTRTPGVKQVTLLRRRPDLSWDDFIWHWHEVHTPLALEVHPLTGYSRNVVSEALSESAPAYDGIVELSFAAHEDLSDPERFFGEPGNAQRIVDDVRKWLDFEAIEYYAMSEYVIRDAESVRGRAHASL